jgi:hypothetical protein
MKKVYPSLEVLSYPDHHAFSRSEVKFIEKKVDVLKAFYFVSDEVAASEHDKMALFLKERNNK